MSQPDPTLDRHARLDARRAQELGAVRVAAPTWREAWPGWRTIPGVPAVGAVARWTVGWLERVLDIPAVFPITIALISRGYSTVVINIAHRFQTEAPPVLTPYGSPFVAWDAQWYLSIAQSGYHAFAIQPGPYDGHHDYAFYPGWPSLLRALDSIGLHPTTWGVVAANLLFVAALVVIFIVMREHFGLDGARRGVALLAFSPAAYVLSMAYSEPLFLLFTGLYFLSRTKRAEAALGWAQPFFAGATMLVRICGLAILASAGAAWLREVWLQIKPPAGSRRPNLRGLRRLPDHRLILSGLSIGAVFGGWWLFIWQLTGNPLGWMTGSPQWDYPAYLGLPAIWTAIQLENLSRFTLGPISVAIVMLVIGVVMLRRHFELGAYSVAAVAMSVLGAPIGSMPRHAMLAFPVFAFVGAKLGHRRSLALIVVLGLMQCWFAFMTFTGHQPMAP